MYRNRIIRLSVFSGFLVLSPFLHAMDLHRFLAVAAGTATGGAAFSMIQAGQLKATLDDLKKRVCILENSKAADSEEKMSPDEHILRTDRAAHVQKECATEKAAGYASGIQVANIEMLVHNLQTYRIRLNKRIDHLKSFTDDHEKLLIQLAHDMQRCIQFLDRFLEKKVTLAGILKARDLAIARDTQQQFEQERRYNLETFVTREECARLAKFLHDEGSTAACPACIAQDFARIGQQTDGPSILRSLGRQALDMANDAEHGRLLPPRRPHHRKGLTIPIETISRSPRDQSQTGDTKMKNTNIAWKT